METACHDFFKMAPDGVSICAITSNVEHWNKENFKQAVIDPLVALARLQDVTPAHIAAVAKRVLGDAKKTDGIYIPCNQWAAADAVPIIEAECGLPVVSGAHADHWEAFRVLGIHDPPSGNGRLMESLRQDANAFAVPSA